MPIDNIIIIILYSLKPYWWAVAAAVLLPVICYVIRPATFYVPSNISMVIGFVVGVCTGLATPYATKSGFIYVETPVDWALIVLITLGISFYIWLNLQILSRD